MPPSTPPRRPRTLARRPLVAAAAAAPAALASLASADVVAAQWLPGGGNFEYRLIHMPDFDARRAAGPDPAIPGLPNDGLRYCLPASIMNMTGYIALHGQSSVEPGAAAWQAAATYDPATASLAQFGVLAGTDPLQGTSLAGAAALAQTVLPDTGFVVTAQGLTPTYAPTIDDFAQFGVLGGLVTLCHGWYQEVGDASGGIPDVVRSGGHCMTLTRAKGGLFGDTLAVHDSGDSPADQAQSTFIERDYCWASEPVIVDGTLRTLDRIRPGLDCIDPGFRYVDAFVGIMPTPGILSPFDGPFVLELAPGVLDGLEPEPIAFPGLEGDVVDAMLGPDFTQLYAIVEDGGGSAQLVCAALLDPAWVPIPEVIVAPGAQAEFGPSRDLYLVSDGELQRVLLDAEVPDVVASAPVAAESPSLTVDPVGGAVMVLDPTTGQLATYDAALAAPPAIVTLPELAEGPADAMIHWDPSQDVLWYLAPGEPVLQRITMFVGIPPLVEAVELPGLVAPRSVDVADGGILMIVDGDTWKAFGRDPDTNAWMRLEDHPFDGATTGPIARIGTSTTNWDPAIHEPEAWQHVPPASFGTPITPCPADFDLDETVGFGDLLTVLAAWGPCDPTVVCDQDLDFDGTVGFSDLLGVLAAWGDCP